MTNKILAFILSLCTAGGPAAGTVLGTVASEVIDNVDLPKFPTQAIVQKVTSNLPNGGELIDFPFNY
jgi:hypothetical protein